jgi:hypothetical protein
MDIVLCMLAFTEDRLMIMINKTAMISQSYERFEIFT